MRKRPIADRFWEKVNKNGPVHPRLKTKCWLWTASKSNGYGQFGGPSGESPERAHRVAWRLVTGVITSGFEICHECDVRACVNPSHLRLDTHRSNVQDAVKRNPRFGSGGRKLSDEQIKVIIASAESGPVLASRFGVSKMLISKIRNNRAWKSFDRSHVSCPTCGKRWVR